MEAKRVPRSKRVTNPETEAGWRTLASSLRRCRTEAGLTLDALALRSGVSRSMISKIEREAAIPTLLILSRLAAALDHTVSQLMGETGTGAFQLIRASQQPVIVDAESGRTRRCVSPILPGCGVDVIHNSLPAGACTGALPPHRVGVEEYVYLLAGSLQITVGRVASVLHVGDSLYYRADASHEFRNIGSVAADYLVVINSQTRI